MPLGARPALREPLLLAAGGAGGAGPTAARVETPTQCTSASRACRATSAGVANSEPAAPRRTAPGPALSRRCAGGRAGGQAGGRRGRRATDVDVEAEVCESGGDHLRTKAA